MRKAGFNNPVLDKSAQGLDAYLAIRGREQQLIDFYGGIGDEKVANHIRAVSKLKIVEGRTFHNMSNLYFGPLSPYTGF